LTTAAAARRSRLVLCLATVYLVWSASFLVTKIGVRSLPPLLFGSLRFMVGGALLFAVARLIAARRGGALWPAIDATTWRSLLIVGALCVLVSNGLNVWGIQHVASNEAALLNVSSPFMIALLGTLGPRAHPLSRRVLSGLVLGAIGILLVILPRAGTVSGSALHGWAVVAILVGCAGWAAGTIYQRNAAPGLDLMSFTGLQMFCGGVMMLVPALLLGEPARWHWDPPGLAALVWMIVMSSCIAYTAYAWLSVHATPAQTGSFGLVTPALAALLGWWILDEHLTAAQVVGMAVILAGVMRVNWPRADTG
jgi:drug/metabolite transporter (DMT)-like permease